MTKEGGTGQKSERATNGVGGRGGAIGQPDHEQDNELKQRERRNTARLLGCVSGIAHRRMLHITRRQVAGKDRKDEQVSMSAN